MRYIEVLKMLCVFLRVVMNGLGKEGREGLYKIKFNTMIVLYFHYQNYVPANANIPRLPKKLARKELNGKDPTKRI